MTVRNGILYKPNVNNDYLIEKDINKDESYSRIESWRIIDFIEINEEYTIHVTKYISVKDIEDIRNNYKKRGNALDIKDCFYFCGDNIYGVTSMTKVEVEIVGCVGITDDIVQPQRLHTNSTIIFDANEIQEILKSHKFYETW